MLHLAQAHEPAFAAVIVRLQASLLFMLKCMSLLAEHIRHAVSCLASHCTVTTFGTAPDCREDADPMMEPPQLLVAMASTDWFGVELCSLRCEV